MRNQFIVRTFAVALAVAFFPVPSVLGSGPTADPESAGEILTPHLSERINGVRHYRNQPQQGSFFSEITVEVTDADRAAVQRACESFETAAGSDGESRVLTLDDSFELPVPRKRIAPDYNAEARKNQVEGYVLFELLIKADGSVAGVCPKSMIGGSLMESAIETLWLWEFKPASLEGNPTPVVLRLELHYALRSSGKRS